MTKNHRLFYYYQNFNRFT